MNKKFILAASLVLILLALSVGFLLGKNQNKQENPAVLGGLIHNTQESFDEGIAVDGTEVISGAGAFSPIATTTLQETRFGSRYNKDLTFTAGATTTVGGLFSKRNTTGNKLCRQMVVDVETGGGANSGNVTIKFATSTSATNWSNGGALIASTTVATATSPLLMDTNTFASNGNIYFEWDDGVYINGAVEAGYGWAAHYKAGNASSTSYTSMAGTVYLDCFQRY